METVESKQQDYIDRVLKKCKFFRQTQVWPLASELDFEGWINNFESLKDKYLACVILSSFIYYSDDMMTKLLYDSVGKACACFHEYRSHWRHEDHKRQVIYSYIPGERPNISDSGYGFIHKLKNDLHIPEENFVDFNLLMNLLQNTTHHHNVVFVDDIVGSGCQCVTALTKKIPDINMSLLEMAKQNEHLLAYAPLVANEMGVNLISKKCPDLFLTPAHILTDEYNLFSPRCICWNNDEDLFCEGIAMIRRVSAAHGIPEQYPNLGEEVDVRGFCNQGLAIAFKNGIPDAVPAFFFFNEKGWTPLMHREYKRIYQS